LHFLLAFSFTQSSTNGAIMRDAFFLVCFAYRGVSLCISPFCRWRRLSLCWQSRQFQAKT